LIHFLKRLMNENVVHDPRRNKFYIRLSKEKKGILLYERLGEKLFDFYHTEVPVEFRGRGLGAVLARAAIDYIIQNGAEVKLSCSFLQKFAIENLTETELKHVKP